MLPLHRPQNIRPQIQPVGPGGDENHRHLGAHEKRHHRVLRYPRRADRCGLSRLPHPVSPDTRARGNRPCEKEIRPRQPIHNIGGDGGDTQKPGDGRQGNTRTARRVRPRADRAPHPLRQGPRRIYLGLLHRVACEIHRERRFRRPAGPICRGILLVIHLTLRGFRHSGHRKPQRRHTRGGGHRLMP